MPIMREETTKDGERVGYFQYGSSGKKYYYEPGNKQSREKAYQKALKQMKAIKANK